MKIPAVFLASRTDQAPDPTGGRRGGGSMIFIGLDANTTTAGRVADISLSYRLPDSTERLTHSMTLDYNRDPSETLEDPYLSYPSMHERYAMYNTFLALKLAATLAEDDYGCALAVLTAARTVLAAWVPAHEADQDLAADLALVDLFIANLRETGTPERTVEQCISGVPSDDDDVGSDDTDDDWGDDYGDDDYYDDEPRTGMFVCSAGGNPSNPLHALVVVGALIAISRRRRR
jgi:MYXO-CTERM domain-containing protein